MMAEPDLVHVLLPLALEGPYSYRIPPGMRVSPGDYVRVPLGSRSVIGVVWDGPATLPDGAKLRDVTERYDMPPLPGLHRRFVDWVASYYLEPSGSVLRMVLRCPGVFAGERRRIAYRLAGSAPERLTPQRRRVLAFAAEAPSWSPAELAAAAGVGAGVVKSLAREGALEAVELPADRPFPPPDLTAGAVTLSKSQDEAAGNLRAMVAARGATVALLDGVTGSGKTEVYFEAMAAALASGRQVLLLLPEIALTAGFLARVEARFGAEPALWHSDLRPRERERAWRAIAAGQAKIVVGARSALFLPWASLGLIVVDEEHEGAYKQEDGIAYHARDMAIVYGALGRFPVILSSATPSLETIVNCDRGRYRRVALADRYGRPELPEIGLIDMKHARTAPGDWLSEPLVEAVAAALDRGEQALLFLNRRGYAPLTLCRACGHRLDCPNCAASLVEHRFRRQLLCHHCGHIEPLPDTCPSCGAEGKLVPVGPGIERLAEEAERRFPRANIVVLSSDVTRGRLLRDALRDVEQGRVNLVIGTQLVAKGHHFPHLTLAGIVDADLALESSDPRAGERTWAQLAQVAGRAGRGERPGRALVQTYLPEHPLMRALKSGDRDGYLGQEKKIREAALLPPYGRLAAIIVSANEASAVERFAKDLARQSPDADGITVLGPAAAPLHLVRGRYRWRFLVKARRDVDVQAFLRNWLAGVKPQGSLALAIDVDPYSFL